ncbi:GPI-anchored protein LLG1-like [Cynara cardunculus var. scolymus]|uniref:GPI-anchored protein LLG1-like domain-containing protein n=1 Tax=Cynara cardunculus var. scolymus TaxID=59895 RepID=A0A103Y4J2_CYNCS|nr:GPI-anchored protein LLG1-like [Cynara cardunculus var. scolymus]KVI02349.1 hypothetical protein Ccrd_019351 [Cynara cardunculus var. scolymus]
MKIAIRCFLLLLLLSSCCFSSPISLSDNVVFTSQPSIRRNLLQAAKPCPVNLESMNYTIITSSCKGPKYSANICCQALKDFACPFTSELDDLSNDCSTVMFSYINRYGNYPPGLFSSLCHGDNVGLPCDAVPPGVGRGGVTDDSNHTPTICNPSSLLILTTGFLILFF